jgi:hypothetical protein
MVRAEVGQVAQLVEHSAENRGVAGSIPALPIMVWIPAPRIIVRIDVPQQSLDNLQKAAERFGMTQVTVASLLVQFASRLDDKCRAAVLGQCDGDAARLILEAIRSGSLLAREPAPSSSTLPPPETGRTPDR